MNTNLASMISTAELRQLERQYANPNTPIQGLILRGIQAQLKENSASHEVCLVFGDTAKKDAEIRLGMKQP